MTNIFDEDATVVLIDEWEVRPAIDDPRCPPEESGIVLRGRVKGHPRKPDGMRVTTSCVADAKGRTVRTESGTVYELGRPSEGYLAWLKANRPNWDPENPITIL